MEQFKYKYFIARNLEKVENYKGKKPILITFSKDKKFDEWDRLIKALKPYGKVYVKTICSHFSIMLRDSGIKVVKV